MRIDETNFIKYLKKKNEKALDYTIDTYGGLIKSIVNKHLYSMNDYHEECIQDVFLAVWYGIDKYDNEKGNFINWIAAITKYKCIMYKRKYSVLNLNQDIQDVDIEIDNIGIEMKKRELKEEIDILLGNLRPKDKKIFIEYYIEEKTVKEIAMRMDIKDENIYNIR